MPTPWKKDIVSVGKDWLKGYLAEGILSGDNVVAVCAGDDAVAARIICYANSHDALVTACKLVLGLCETSENFHVIEAAKVALTVVEGNKL
jgi:hypothetical protein